MRSVRLPVREIGFPYSKIRHEISIEPSDFPMHRPVIRALTRRQVLTGYCRPKILPGGDAQLAMPLRTWRTKASLYVLKL